MTISDIFITSDIHIVLTFQPAKIIHYMFQDPLDQYWSKPIKILQESGQTDLS